MSITELCPLDSEPGGRNDHGHARMMGAWHDGLVELENRLRKGEIPVPQSCGCFEDDECTHEERPLRAPCYLNVYEETLSYGGPQEGGWWYTSGTPVASYYIANDDLIGDTFTLVERAFAPDPHDRERRRGASSAARGYDVRVRVQKEQARPYPNRRPHYE